MSQQDYFSTNNNLPWSCHCDDLPAGDLDPDYAFLVALVQT
jgi:hypothetical protein